MATLREKIGQMIMIGLKGEELTWEEKRLFKDYPFGGFILFSHNLREPKQILQLCRSLWGKKKELPPFIAIDQEGGRVHRLPPPFTHFPPAAAVGRTGNADLAYRVGQATARELSAVGINLNFAPVLDVHSNPNNPVIGDRSLSSDPRQVTTLGWPMIKGLRAGGIIPCGKHFPGHGDTAKDSHLELPTVEKDVATLMTVELPPFIYACRNDIESLMTAHVLYPSLDPRHPATLSHAVITQLLRQELDYEGVVFGDDLEMKAISKDYTLEETVALSVNAGVDVLMFTRQTELAIQACEFLCQRAEKEPEIKARVEESYQRIKRLKQRYITSFTGASEAELKNLIGLPQHRKIVDQIQGNL
ncbi:MAG: beta-N-acetylhexosaminidase [Deltaproteobacteria bacterium]|nr:beta-N-acetylhexosaminidase [Deltaproteobacteria bacterium]